MKERILLFIMAVLGALILTACDDDEALGQSSFGNIGAKAAPASVISMGRDDDDGKAIKWHIGGQE